MRTRRPPAIRTHSLRVPAALGAFGAVTLAALLTGSSPRAQTYTFGSSNPNSFSGGPYTLRNLFAAATPQAGAELYEAKVGTPLPPRMVKDIRSGDRSSFPKYLTEDPSRPGKVWFSANDGANGRELWQSDGTSLGTRLVRDIRSGPRGSQPANLMLAVNGALFFTAGDDNAGRELWQDPGSGAARVRDIAPGSASSHPAWLTAFGSRLLFSADDRSTGGELWISDGTAAGTVMLKDIRAGTASSAPSDIVVITIGATTWAYFAATTDANGRELWKTDGTAVGTMLVSDIQSGPASSAPDALTAVPGAVLFTANDAVNGRELWISDAAGTRLVRDVRPGGRGSSIKKMVASGRRVWFSADDGTAAGVVLWQSDGTLATTIPLGGPRPRDLTPLGSSVVFSATTASSGRELWVSDGTQATTRQLPDIRPGAESSWPSNFVVGAGSSYVLFCAMGPGGAELWGWGPILPGPILVADLNRTSINPPELHVRTTIPLQANFDLSRMTPNGACGLLVALQPTDPIVIPGFQGALRVDPFSLVLAIPAIANGAGQVTIAMPIPPLPPGAVPIATQAIDISGAAFGNGTGYSCGRCDLSSQCYIRSCGHFDDLTWEYSITVETSCPSSLNGYVAFVLTMFDGGGYEEILLDTWPYSLPSEGTQIWEGTLEDLIPPEYGPTLKSGDHVELRWFAEHPAGPAGGCTFFISYC